MVLGDGDVMKWHASEAHFDAGCLFPCEQHREDDVVEKMTGGVTVIAGEAPETDDEEEQSYGDVQENRSLKEHTSQNSEWKPSDIVRRWWSVHIDEKLEQRWRALGADVTLFTVRQSAARRKQFELLKNATTNTQHIVHEVSFNVGRAIENLARLEANVSLLLVGAKLVPDLLVAFPDCDMPHTD